MSKIGPTVRVRLSSKKPCGAGDEDAAVPEPAGGLALGGRADDGAEEGDAVDGDDRRADVVADQVDRALVAGPQRVVVLVGRGGVGELGGQAERLERRRRWPSSKSSLAVVDALAERVVERLDDLVAVLARGRR